MPTKYNERTGSPSTKPNGANLAQLAGQDPIGDTRGWVRNLATEEDLSFWFRPKPIRETIRARYGTMSVIGMSHSYHTYEYTDNVKIAFELYVNRLMLVKMGAQQMDAQYRDTELGNKEGGLTDLKAYSDLMEQDRRFLEALQYPPEGVPGVLGTSPPACVLVLPGVCTLRCRMTGLNITHEDVDLNGHMKEFRAKVDFEEAPLARITMEDVRDNGMFRVWGEL